MRSPVAVQIDAHGRTRQENPSMATYKARGLTVHTCGRPRRCTYVDLKGNLPNYCYFLKKRCVATRWRCNKEIKKRKEGGSSPYAIQPVVAIVLFTKSKLRGGTQAEAIIHRNQTSAPHRGQIKSNTDCGHTSSPRLMENYSRWKSRNTTCTPITSSST